MKFYNQNFEERLNKRFVQSLFYSLSNVRGNVLMLCGPALRAHLHDAKTILTNSNKQNKVTIYEINKEMYLKNKSDLVKLNPSFKVEIIKGNIIDAKIEKFRFVDFDACKRLPNIKKEVEIVYNRMLQNPYSDKYKNIIITTTLRGVSLDTAISIFCSMFNIENNFLKTDIKLGKKSRLYKNIGKNYTSHYMTYKDGSPMLTFSFQWK